MHRITSVNLASKCIEPTGGPHVNDPIKTASERVRTADRSCAQAAAKTA